MKLTEEQARQKKCPLMMTVGVLAAQAAQAGASINGALHLGCNASDCMMWRWVDPARQLKDTRKYPFGPSRNLQIALAPEEDFEVNPSRRGECGLAGKPDQ